MGVWVWSFWIVGWFGVPFVRGICGGIEGLYESLTGGGAYIGYVGLLIGCPGGPAGSCIIASNLIRMILMLVPIFVMFDPIFVTVLVRFVIEFVKLAMFAFDFFCSCCIRRILLLCSLSCSAKAVEVCRAAVLCATAYLLFFVTPSRIFWMLGGMRDGFAAVCG